MSLIPPPEDSPYPELYWMAIAGVIFAFFMAFGIGANDVGNCFATTVAAKSLTLLQVRADEHSVAGAVMLFAVLPALSFALSFSNKDARCTLL